MLTQPVCNNLISLQTLAKMVDIVDVPHLENLLRARVFVLMIYRR